MCVCVKSVCEKCVCLFVCVCLSLSLSLSVRLLLSLCITNLNHALMHALPLPRRALAPHLSHPHGCIAALRHLEGGRERGGRGGGEERDKRARGGGKREREKREREKRERQSTCKTSWASPMSLKRSSALFLSSCRAQSRGRLSVSASKCVCRSSDRTHAHICMG